MKIVFSALLLILCSCQSPYAAKRQACLNQDRYYCQMEFGEFTKCKPDKNGDEVCIIYSHPYFNEVWFYFGKDGKCHTVITR